MAADVERCREAGFAAHWTKPVHQLEEVAAATALPVIPAVAGIS